MIDRARSLTGSAPARLDLTDAAHQDLVTGVADGLLAAGPDGDSLQSLESDLLLSAGPAPLAAHLGVKLARGRRAVLDLAKAAHLSVVFAVYREERRILGRDQDPLGEDFLRRKVAQLDWLVRGTGTTWDMVVVDDGCPAGSGRIAAEIVEAEGLQDRVKVLFLADAIAAGDPVTRPLATPDDSRKGGSIALGMDHAARRLRGNHVILFTDADLSTHLGQSGLLMQGILDQGYDAAIGSRREAASVVVKQGVRNDRGKLFIYLWKRLFALLDGIVDTQCGFKAFRGERVPALVDGLLEKKFAFDIELLIRTEQHRPGAILRCPVAWLDSEALSTTTDLQPYLPMLQAMVKMYRTYLDADPAADEFAAFIEGLDEDAWARLVENIPAAITQREPAQFGGFSGVSARGLRAAAGS